MQDNVNYGWKCIQCVCGNYWFFLNFLPSNIFCWNFPSIYACKVWVEEMDFYWSKWYYTWGFEGWKVKQYQSIECQITLLNFVIKCNWICGHTNKPYKNETWFFAKTPTPKTWEYIFFKMSDWLTPMVKQFITIENERWCEMSI